MSDPTSDSAPSTPTPNAGETPKPSDFWQFDPPAFFAALGNPLRWQLFQMIARGKEWSAMDAAKALGRDFDGVAKHLRILREARVVCWKYGEDRRLTLHYLPQKFLTQPGVVNYGFCSIQFEKKS